MGFDASKGERNLKIWAKGYTKTARKCGQNIFIEQTARRVAEHLVLQRANQLLHSIDIRTISDNPVVDDNSASPSWHYTRNSPHLTYNIGTDKAYGSDGTLVDCHLLLTDEIKNLLRATHGETGEVGIWKEIRVNLANGQGHHHVRAFHEFDQHGSFFDWAEIECDDIEEVQGTNQNNVDHSHQDMDGNEHQATFEAEDNGKSSEAEESPSDYRPALVLLLYQISENSSNHAIIWKATDASEIHREIESNISAQWSMEVHPRNGCARIQSIPMNRIKSCISVYKYWNNPKTQHFHPLSAINPQEATRSRGFTVLEQYDTYSWLLNLVDTSRWQEEETQLNE